VINLLGDEHFPVAAIDAVRRLVPGLIFDSTHDLGIDGITDPELLEYAAGGESVIVTFDKRTLVPDAEARIRTGQHMAGVILVHPEAKSHVVISDLALIAACSEREDLNGQIVHVPLR
jgi:hypothetical protein